MKTKLIGLTSFNRSARTSLGLALSAAVASLSVLCASAQNQNGGDNDQGEQGTRYRQINLVSDQAGKAQLQDTNLVNAWGISHASSSPFWVSDNGTGKATLYAVTNDALGFPHVTRNSRVVTIPGDGNPTGQLFNNTTAFNGDIFIFASEDGTISGWRPALGNNAEVLASRGTAVYKGITLATNGSGPVLLAANFHEGFVDVYGVSNNLVAQYADSSAPAGYAPFGVQNVNGIIFVTFAVQDAARHDDVPGRGHGLIDIFDPVTGAFIRFATGSAAGGGVSQMNSPWGVALAPATFGTHGDQLLVGNFGSGTIMSFGPTGSFRGLLLGPSDNPIRIDGLWGLSIGGSGSAGVSTDLYFSAGPDGESHGLFGVIQKIAHSENDQN